MTIFMIIFDTVNPITFGLILEAFGFFYIFPDTRGFLITVAFFIRGNEFAVPSLRKSNNKWRLFMTQYYIANDNAWMIGHWIQKSRTAFGWVGFGLIVLGLFFQSQYFMS